MRTEFSSSMRSKKLRRLWPEALVGSLSMRNKSTQGSGYEIEVITVFWRKCTAVWMKWTAKHKNLTTASDSFVFRSGENKPSKTCQWWDKTNASEGRVVRPYSTSGTSQKTRLKAELQRHASRAEQRLARRREQEPPNRELKRFYIYSRRRARGDWTFQQNRNKRQQHLYNHKEQVIKI